MGWRLSLNSQARMHRLGLRYGSNATGSVHTENRSMFVELKIAGDALQADGETRSVVTASSIRRRSAAWSILLDWTFRSRRRASDCG